MGDCMKEGEKTSQRTYVQEPWTWTRVWELPEGVGGLSETRQRGKTGTTNSINNEI